MGEPYAHPEVLVSADWVQEHLNDPKVRIVESDEDVLLYDMGHIPGAVKIDWQGDLQDQLIRDYIDAEKFAAICSRAGIANDTTVVFYGDKSNWWACYAFWAFKLFGHEDCRVMNGGRKLWIDQRPPHDPRGPQVPADPVQGRGERGGQDPRLPRRGAGPLQGRPAPARRPQPQGVHRREAPHGGLPPGRGAPRRPHPRRGQRPLGPGGQRGRHLQVAARSSRRSTSDEVGLKPGDDVVAYCRIGERSSLTWFVLTYLLGYQKVRNYDGSWCEWGNLVRAPIAKGA